MKKFLVGLVSVVAVACIFQYLTVSAAATPPALGGTGTSQVPQVGQTLIGNGSSSYTPALLTPGTDIVIQTASGTITIAVNASAFLPSSTVYVATVNGQNGAVTITSSTLGVATNTLSLFNGNNFTTTTIQSVLNTLSATGLATYNSSTGAFAVSSSSLNLGSASQRSVSDFLPSSTVYVATVNGQSGTITITSAATTTINGTQAAVFHIVGDGTTVTTNQNGATTTFSILTTGNWVGTWQGANSTTFYLASNPNNYISSSTGNSLYYPLNSNPAGYATSTGIATGTVVTLGSPATVGGNATATVYGVASNNSTNNTSYIPQLDGVYTVPLNYATAGCNGSSTLTDFGGCVNSLEANAPSVPYYIGINVPTGLNVPSSTWKTPIVFGNNGILVSFDCPGGARLHYGGTGAAVTFNSYDSAGHERSQDYGCTYMGHDTFITAGQTNTATTTGIVFGGASGQNNGLGSVGVDFHDNTINGFGLDEYHGAVNYMFTSEFNAYSGWNGGGTVTVYGNSVPGAGVSIAASSNSGENMQWLNDTITDGGNSTSSFGFYGHDNAFADCKIIGGSIDDATTYFGIVNGCDVSYVHFENSDPSQYPGYPYIYAAPSSGSSLNLYGNTFDNDASTGAGQPPEFVEEAVGDFTATGNYFDRYGSNSAITIAIDHSIGASIPHEIFCGNHNQNSAYTNLANNLPDSIAASNAGCWSESANSYAIGMLANGNNTNSFYSGSVVAGIYDHSGNWTFPLGYVSVSNASATTTPAFFSTNGSGSMLIDSNVNPSTATQVDNTKPAWRIAVSQSSDSFSIQRSPATTTFNPTTILTISNTGKVTFGSISSTVLLGSSGHPGCFETFDSVNSTTLDYMYPASGIFVVTTTKPAFCQ
jgi:hypothetical protein